nr:hypothetical protein CFP56_20464 [Quercus suber]
MAAYALDANGPRHHHTSTSPKLNSIAAVTQQITGGRAWSSTRSTRDVPDKHDQEQNQFGDPGRPSRTHETTQRVYWAMTYRRARGRILLMGGHVRNGSLAHPSLFLVRSTPGGRWPRDVSQIPQQDMRQSVLGSGSRQEEFAAILLRDEKSCWTPSYLLRRQRLATDCPGWWDDTQRSSRCPGCPSSVQGSRGSRYGHANDYTGSLIEQSQTIQMRAGLMELSLIYIGQPVLLVHTSLCTLVTCTAQKTSRAVHTAVAIEDG